MHPHNATAVPYQWAHIETQTPEIQSKYHLSLVLVILCAVKIIIINTDMYFQHLRQQFTLVIVKCIYNTK